MDEDRKRVVPIAAAILAARKLAQYDRGKRREVGTGPLGRLVFSDTFKSQLSLLLRCRNAWHVYFNVLIFIFGFIA